MARTVSERKDALPALAEVFREHGFAGASLALISAATGLGKGSLYHFYPGGKEEMAAAVLEEIDGWFETRIFRPLREGADPGTAIAAAFDDVDAYFRSGQRVCLVGAFALGDARDLFGQAVNAYFARWIGALADALKRAGRDSAAAQDLAEEIVLEIQGAIVLARAMSDPAIFQRALKRMRARVEV